MKMVMLILRVISTGRCPQSSNSPPPSLLEDKARDDRFQEKLKYIYIHTHHTVIHLYIFFSLRFDSSDSFKPVHPLQRGHIYIYVYIPHFESSRARREHRGPGLGEIGCPPRNETGAATRPVLISLPLPPPPISFCFPMRNKISLITVALRGALRAGSRASVYLTTPNISLSLSPSSRESGGSTFVDGWILGRRGNSGMLRMYYYY